MPGLGTAGFSLAPIEGDFAAPGDLDERAREHSVEFAPLDTCNWNFRSDGFYAAGRKRNRSWHEKIRDIAG